jgi:hypothetical protein
LYQLKEVLVAESLNLGDLVLSVFWGLLACGIVNQKDKEWIEHTALKKLKEMIEKLWVDQIQTYQENMN